MTATLLLLSIFLPALGAFALLGAVRSAGRTVWWCAMGTTGLTLAAVAVVAFHAPSGGEAFAVFDVPWLVGPAIDIRFHIGLDGLSVWLYGLTALLAVTAVAVSYDAIRDDAAAFYRLLLLLETGLLGTFAARDLILFCVFLEATLIPLFLLVGRWGDEGRRFAATKFLLHTLVGSSLVLVGSVSLMVAAGDGQFVGSIPAAASQLAADPPGAEVQLWILAALATGIAIQVPLWPLHTWLPVVQRESPTAVNLLLAGVLAKVGIYALLRFAWPMLPGAMVVVGPWVAWLAAAGFVFGALVAFAQYDVRGTIAYATVSQLALCILGLFVLDATALHGSVLLMLGHGLSIGLLLALAGVLHDRVGSGRVERGRAGSGRLEDLRGAARGAPRLAVLLVIAALALVGLPATSGFAAGRRILSGALLSGEVALVPWQSTLMATAVWVGVGLTFLYVAALVARLFARPAHGEAESSDLSLRELMATVPLAAGVLWIGLWPGFVLDRLSPTLDRLTTAAVASSTESPTESPTEGTNEP